MGSRPEYEEARLIEDLERRLSSPLLYVSLAFEVWERDGDEGARLARTVDDLHLLVDRISGERVCLRADELDGEVGEMFLELVEDDAVERVPLVFSAHEKQLALVRDEDHRVIGAFGGQRGGKTHCLGMWMVRQWMIKGGQGVDAWWVSPSRAQTAIGVNKLFRGEDDVPPLFDPRLVLSYPEKPELADQAARLIDGTKIHMKHASAQRKGGQLKGYGPRFIGVDEACEIRESASWRIIRGRVNKRGGHKGQIFLASTPMPGHWAYTEVVLRVDSANDKNYTYDHLSMADNVWIPRSEIDEAIKDAGGKDDPVCQREVFGMWVFAGSRLWHAFDPARHVQEATPEELGLYVINKKVAAEHWPRLVYNADNGLGGQDFNNYPMTTVICQVCIPHGERDTGDNRVYFYTHEHVSKNKGTQIHGLELVQRGFPDLPIVCDSTGDQKGHRLKLHADQSYHEADDLRAAGHAVIPAMYSEDGNPINPPQLTSIRVVHGLLHQDRLLFHPRCSTLITAMATQQATDRGKIKKKPGDADDRMSSPTDAMRYQLWVLAGDEVLERDPERVDTKWREPELDETG